MSQKQSNLAHPLMLDNITREDADKVVDFLGKNWEPVPKLTNGPKVIEFEEKWSKWLGVQYSVMFNSGAAANHLTMLAYKYKAWLKDPLHPPLRVVVPPLTWVSDISSVVNNGLELATCDINLSNLSFDIEKLKIEIAETKPDIIFLTHVLGLNGITDELLDLCYKHDITLVEDVCESHGAKFNSRRCGSIGHTSNFSFYYAHHMSTIEGGMICTNDHELYQIIRALRSHGMSREMTDETMKDKVTRLNPELNPDFIFLYPSFNFRSTEINAVLGMAQLEKLDQAIDQRNKNFNSFLDLLDPTKFIVDLDTRGMSSYSMIVIMKEPDKTLRNEIELTLRLNKIEFRRGLSGGGNQLRQPFFKRGLYLWEPKDFPNVEHVHEYSWYVGNYPTEISAEKLKTIASAFNNPIKI